MTIYTLINPSDPYTFEAPSDEIAALAVLLLGNGAYGADNEQGEQVVPVMLGQDYGRIDRWYQDRFGRCLEDGLEALGRQAGDCLGTFFLGSVADYRSLVAVLAGMEDRQVRAFLRVWHSQHQTSTNNIGQVAHRLGRQLQEAQE